MFSFFNKNKKVYTGQRTDISYQFKTLQRYMVLDLERVQLYYRNTKRYVTSSDFLYRIMRFYGLDVDGEYIPYITSIDNTLKITQRHFGISSYYNHGRFTKLNHYYFEMKQDYDIFDTPDNLLKISALNIMANDNISLYYPHPITSVESFSIRGIDLKLLMIQYYHWYHKEDNNQTYKTFLDTVIYPNAIKSMSNTALINRFIFRDLDSFDLKQHPFHIISLHTKFNTLIKKYNKEHTKGSILAVDMIREIPTIDNNALDYLRIQYPVFNSYNALPYFFIYARILKALYDNMNGKSRRLFKSRIRTENIMFMKIRSLDLERIDFGELTKEKDELITFFRGLL